MTWERSQVRILYYPPQGLGSDRFESCTTRLSFNTMGSVKGSFQFSEVYRDLVAYVVPGFLFLLALPLAQPAFTAAIIGAYQALAWPLIAATVLTLSFVIGKVARSIGRALVRAMTALASIVRVAFGITKEKRFSTELLNQANKLLRMLFVRASFAHYKDADESEVAVYVFQQDNALVRRTADRHRSTQMYYEALFALSLAYACIWSWWFLLLAAFFFYATRNSTINAQKFGAKIRLHLHIPLK